MSQNGIGKNDTFLFRQKAQCIRVWTITFHDVAGLRRSCVLHATLQFATRPGAGQTFRSNHSFVALRCDVRGFKLCSVFLSKRLRFLNKWRLLKVFSELCYFDVYLEYFVHEFCVSYCISRVSFSGTKMWKSLGSISSLDLLGKMWSFVSVK